MKDVSLMKMLLLILLFDMICGAHLIPKFCDFNYADTAFNLGETIYMTRGNWQWTNKNGIKSVTEPPKNQSKLYNGWYIRGGTEIYSNCEEQSCVTNNLIIKIFYNPNTTQEEYRVQRRVDYEVEDVTNESAIPMDLQPSGSLDSVKIWPKGWTKDTYRPFAYYEVYKELIFIVNDITPVLWWYHVDNYNDPKLWRHRVIDSNRYIGIFELNKEIYVITEKDDANREKVHFISSYNVIESERSLISTNEDIASFFQCNLKTTTNSAGKSQLKDSTTIVIITIIIIVVCAIVIFGGVFGYLFYKTITGSRSYKSSSMRSESTRSDSHASSYADNRSMVSSIVTINSETGVKEF